MTAVESVGRFTRADFEALPDDGRRYELLDGAFVVTPSPVPSHQRAARGLFRLLDRSVPDGLEVFFAPLDAYLPTGDILEPDVMVIDPAIEVGGKLQGGVPLLVVEVLSPSSRRRWTTGSTSRSPT